MKNKKLLILAGGCLFIRIWTIVDFVLFFESTSTTYIMYSIISLILEVISLLCVVGAFLCDGKGKRKGAITCTVICLLDALMRHFILSHVLLAERMALVELLKFIAYIIPDVLLMVFVMSKNRSRNTWMIIGILLTLSTICDDYTLPLYRLYAYYSMSEISMYSMMIKVFTGILHGLIYLFGFMNAGKEQSKTSYSYLERYKREHGMD